jgi:hypothetical protein
VGHASNTNPEAILRTPRWARRKSALFLMRSALNRSTSPGVAKLSSREFFAAMGAPARQDIASGFGGHTGAKPMTTLAHDPARLVGALHGWSPGGRLQKEARF